jgi:hypothetical protein
MMAFVAHVFSPVRPIHILDMRDGCYVLTTQACAPLVVNGELNSPVVNGELTSPIVPSWGIRRGQDPISPSIFLKSAISQGDYGDCTRSS